MQRTPAVVVTAASLVVIAAWSIPAATAAPSDTDSTTSVTAAPGASTQPRTASVLYSLTAGAGSLSAVSGKKRTFVVTLRQTSDQVTWFTDRPDRDAGFIPTIGFVSRWHSYGFDKDPPNVALVVRDRTGSTDTIVATMTRPKLTAKGFLTARLRVISMTQAQALEGHLKAHAGRHGTKVPSRFTSAALFIDNAQGTTVNGCLIQPWAYCPFVDFSGVDLSGVDLSDATLLRVNLTGANLSNADLTNAYLNLAILRGANLSGANLGASLSAADMRDADLRGADLSNADLTSANLGGANLTGAKVASARKILIMTDNKTICTNGITGPCRTELLVGSE